MKLKLKSHIDEYSSEDLLKFKEVTDAREEVTKVYKEQEEERLRKQDKERYDITLSIAEKEKVDRKRVVVGSYNPSVETYVIYDNDNFDEQKASNILARFDSAIWAIDTGYREAEEKNKKVIKELGNIGTGIMRYLTGPSNSEVRFNLK